MSALLPALVTVLLVTGCNSAPLPHSHESPEALARAVLGAIEHKDIDALHALALNREEFTGAIWPELPAAKPERNLLPGFVWGDLNRKSNAALNHTLASHGGARYRLTAVQFLGKSTIYDSYVVHRESELLVVDGHGIERPVRFFGAVVEKNGRFKVFSYVVED